MNEISIRDEIVASSKKNGKWFTVKEICDYCKCSRQTFNNFKSEVAVKAVLQRVRKDSTHAIEYNNLVLEQFQAWLLKNQVNQGSSSELVKQNAMDNLEIGMAANAVMASGSVEAAEQFAKLLIDRTKHVKENKRLEAENKALQVKNESLQIELDESKEWTTLQRYFDNKGWRTDRKKLANISKKLGGLGFERKRIYSVEYANGLWAYRIEDLDSYFFEPAF